MLMHCSFVLILIWICRQAITNDAVGDPSCTLVKYNTTQAKLGQAFFSHLIHDNDSFKNVNEHNICSLMHFFFREATHNGQSVQFVSGEYNAHIDMRIT
jgi:hypothetical protein